MEWLGNGAPGYRGEEPGRDSPSADRGVGNVYHHNLHLQQQQQSTPSSRPCDCSAASLCQSQQRCMKASIVSSWRLAEAQEQLCSLGVHSSESLEQERARTRACPAELTHTEEEWRRKESVLGRLAGSHSPVLGAVSSWDVFDKSIINVQTPAVVVDQDKSKTFVQQFEQEIRHLGMLRRWDDSQRHLANMPHLICEETANYLILWCTRLQQEGKEALMDQVAHQAVVIQFILEMAANSQQDPRGCFRQFFRKAKDGQDVYLEVFYTELEAFKRRLREHTVRCNGKPEPKEAWTSSVLPPMQEYPRKHLLEAGLRTSGGRWTKDDVAADMDDIRMME